MCTHSGGGRPHGATATSRVSDFLNGKYPRTDPQDEAHSKPATKVKGFLSNCENDRGPEERNEYLQSKQT